MAGLAAALAALAVTAGGLPYPAPHGITPTEKTKCDMGTVLAVDAPRAVLRVTTPAGVITYQAGMDAQVFDAKGRPIGAVSKLSPGDKVRVYYLIDDGAKALEVDLE